MEPIRIAQKLQEQFQESVLGVVEHRGQVSVLVDRDVIFDIISLLKDKYKMNHLQCLCGVDNLKRVSSHMERFEVVYQLYSIEKHIALRVKAMVPESDPSIDSIVALWTGANWLERETYDLVGIKFNNHPNLKRVLTPEDWEGHPLRKEYPLRGESEWSGLVELKEKAIRLKEYGFDGAQTVEEAGSND